MVSVNLVRTIADSRTCEKGGARESGLTCTRQVNARKTTNVEDVKERKKNSIYLARLTVRSQ